MSRSVIWVTCQTKAVKAGRQGVPVCLPFCDGLPQSTGHPFHNSAGLGGQHHLGHEEGPFVPAVGHWRLQELDELVCVGGVGPGRRHHLAGPQEGHLQGHGVVVEDQHLVLLLPEVLEADLLGEDDRAEAVAEDGAQHLHQLLVVEVLHAVEVVEVQEDHLAGVRGQESADLLQALAHRGAEEAVGEEELVVGVARLGGDAQVEEADASVQLAGEVHGLRGQPLAHQLLGHRAEHGDEVLHRVRLLWTDGRGLINVEAKWIVGT